MKRLGELLSAAGVAGDAGAEIDVIGVEYDFRRCSPGSLFVAVSGFHVDGHDFIPDAAARGAVAVVSERPVPAAGLVPVFPVADSRAALSALAAAFYDDPSDGMTVAGITGTDGKTTTATMLWAAWQAAGIAAGSLTTVDWRSNDVIELNKSRQTTLEAPELHERLAALRDGGCSHVALETSSHALALHRVDDVAYRAAVFTRITSEHTDLHGSREAYLAAKTRLLHMVSARSDGIAVLDAADDFAFPSLSRIPVSTQLTYSTDPARDADVVAEDVRATTRGVEVNARTPWGAVEMSLQLAGRFNAANALAALTAACATGAPIAEAARGLEGLDRVRGRMERVDIGQPYTVVIDYAHTADSLRHVLHELRDTTTGRLWVVFGSAGERDVEKRAAMGAIAAELADVSVITDEDPRMEDRLRILEQIAAGATDAGGRRGENVVVVPDRTEAIDFAISHAANGDTVLLAGKGHESTLIIGTKSLPWDERAVAESAIRSHAGR